MRYRPLGRSGLEVSEIGLGCASWWGKPAFPERQAIDLVHAAIDAGVTLFDTASSYSAGEAEPRLGRALRGMDTDRLVIATKAGTYHAGGGRIARDFSPSAVTASAERSLRQLGLDALSLLQLHGPAINELNDDLLRALEDLRSRGLVRAIGVNSFDPETIAHVIGLPQVDAVMIDYNVLRPERAPLIARAHEAGKGVLAGMALAMGHTSRRLTSLRGPQDLWYAARALVRHRPELVEGAKFEFLRGLDGMSAPQAALAFVLSNSGVSSALIGTTRRAHLEENLRASGMILPKAILDRLSG